MYGQLNVKKKRLWWVCRHTELYEHHTAWSSQRTECAVCRSKISLLSNNLKIRFCAYGSLLMLSGHRQYFQLLSLHPSNILLSLDQFWHFSCLGLYFPRDFDPRGFLLKILHSILIPPTHATHPPMYRYLLLLLPKQYLTTCRPTDY